MFLNEIMDTPETVEGLCKLARGLGYKDPLHQLTNSDGSCIGDMCYFFDDNPGAIGAVIEWIANNYSSDDE